MANNTLTQMRGVRVAKLSAAAKSVAVFLLLRTGDGKASWASIETLGRDAGYKPTATRNALKQLDAAGLLIRRDNPGRSSLLALKPEPLLALAAQESAESAARELEREQARALAATEAPPPQNPDSTASHSDGQGTAKRSAALRHPVPTPPESGAEMPIQIPKEKQRGKTTTKADSAAVASLIAFGMNENAAAEIAPQMEPGEAERAIGWATDGQKGPGLIVKCVRNGQRPWNTTEDAPPPIDEHRMRALLAEEGGTDETR
jgi:hypothetical protein